MVLYHSAKTAYPGKLWFSSYDLKCSRPIRSLGFSKVNISRTARPFLIIFGMVKGIHERNALFFGKKSICPNLGLKGPKWARLDRKFEFGRIWSCYIPLDCKCHADCRFWKTFVKFAVLGYFQPFLAKNRPKMAKFQKWKQRVENDHVN